MRIDGHELVVVWEAYDGYQGGGRDQETYLCLEDMRGSSKLEMEEFIWDAVQEDFLQKVCPSFDMEEAIQCAEDYFAGAEDDSD